MQRDKSASRLIASAFRWGGSMAAVRLVCSFISIKITAVILGPSGLALVAQYANFLSMLQSMLGQGLVTGAVRLGAEQGDDPGRRRRVYATATWMALGLALLLALVLALSSPWISRWLLTSVQYQWLVAVAGLAVGAAVLGDLLHGGLGVVKEYGLIGNASIVTTLLGLAIFAPSTLLWGLTGALWATFTVMLLAAGVSAVVLHRRSRGVALRDFVGAFDRGEARRIAGFYPMLLVNGMLPPLVLILARDTLASEHSLELAGLWQATWRLSEVYQAAIIASITLYFIPTIGEHAQDPPALRRHILRTLLAATGVTATLALGIYLLRTPIVHGVFSASFEPVVQLLPLQLVGDVLKMAGWIFSMALVASMRTSAFITNQVVASLVFVLLTRLWVPGQGADGVLWAYICSSAVQLALGALALRDVLLPPHGSIPDSRPAAPRP